MEAKNKAYELFEKYWCLQWQVHKSNKSFKQIGMSKSAAKQCALIAVDEILKESMRHDKFICDHTNTGFWIEVKTELEKL